MKDIETAEDIRRLVDSFYDKVKQDEVIGHIFMKIIGDDWSVHLPVMYSFWQTILLGIAGYSGNPMRTHLAVDKEIRLEPVHFERWLILWRQTVDALFTGSRAEEAKKRAGLMAELIQSKIGWARDGKSIL